MKAKFALIAFFLIAFSSLAFSYTIQRLDFTINVNETGTGVVTEKYYFQFADSTDAAAFAQAVKNNGQDLLAWKAFDEKISPYFGTIENVTLQSYSFDQKNKMLELKYSEDNAVASITKQDTRSETWRLRAGFFQTFEQGTILLVPKNTTITIQLPANSVLNESLIPAAVQTTRTSITINNARINTPKIEYTIAKPIAQPAVFSEIFKWMKDSGLLYVIAGILVILIVIAVVKRKELAEKIEDYIVKHSEISVKEETEEIEIEE